MAVIRKREIQRFSKEELEAKLRELNLELLKLKAQKGQATAGTRRIKELKKTIARINTQLNQLK